MTSYTYCLYHKPTGKKYYGVRYKKNCDPSDLWNKYFSSSKEVKKLIEEYGINSFEYEIRKTFDDKFKAIEWEKKVLRRLKVETNDRWLNKRIPNANVTYCASRGMFGKKHTKETKNKMSLSQKGKNNPMYGKTHTDETKRKIGEASKNWLRTEEVKLKQKLAKKGKPFSGYNSITPESNKKRSETLKGHSVSQETREKMKMSRIQYLKNKKMVNINA